MPTIIMSIEVSGEDVKKKIDALEELGLKFIVKQAATYSRIMVYDPTEQ